MVNRFGYAALRNSEPGYEREPIKVCKQRNDKYKSVFSGDNEDDGSEKARIRFKEKRMIFRFLA